MAALKMGTELLSKMDALAVLTKSLCFGGMVKFHQHQGFRNKQFFMKILKRRGNMAAKKWIVCVSTVVLLLSFGLPSYAEPTGSTTLRMVTFQPTKSTATRAAFLLSKKIQGRSGGKVKIEIVGGPEALPGRDQPSAVRNGVFDMLLSPANASLIPEALCLMLSDQTPAQERQNGFYDLMAEIYRKQNVFYLGRAAVDIQFHIMLAKNPVEKLEDLAGLKLRASGTTLPLIKVLGAAPVSVPLPHLFTAMERGVIDGTINPETSFKSWGLASVAKYMVNVPLYGQNLVILVNLDSWNKLPPEYQKMMKDIMAGLENNEIAEIYARRKKGALKLAVDKGVQFIELPAADAKRLANLADEVIWEEVIKKSPDYGPRLRKILAK
jgi:TRAP-type C4-dicarboxylate transport system substrate-binding protein